MIIFLFSFFSRYFILKERIFFGSLFFLDENISFLVFIFPMVYSLFYILDFRFGSLKSEFLHSSILLSILLLLLMSFSSNFSFGFLAFLERCVVLILILIFRFAKDQDKVSSTIFIFLLNIAPSIYFIFFCSLEFGSLNSSIFGLSSSIRIFFWGGFLGLLLSKLPIFLAHFWLTKAHVRASGPGSIILASLLLKIGCVGFYKFSRIFLPLVKKYLPSIFSLSSLGIVLILLVIFRFVDLKYIVACSSVVHMVPIFPLLLKRDSIRVFSCFLIMVGHGIVSYFIFFLVSILYEIRQRKRSYFSKSLESFGSSISMILVLFLLLNIGFPPFIRFLSELLFFYLIFEYSWVLRFLFCLRLLLRGLVFFFVSSKIVFGKKSNLVIPDFSRFLVRVSYIFLFFFSFRLFLYTCSFSL